MHFSPITGQQWVSVVKNACIAGISAFAMAIAGQPVDRSVLIAGGSAALAAAIKVVEKAFTEG